MSRLAVGQAFPPQELTDTTGQTWSFPPNKLTHLQFRRFAGCPICNVHLANIVERRTEIEAAGIQELVVFNSTPSALASVAEAFPLPMVADPTGVLYKALGISTSVLASASLGAMGAAFKGMMRPSQMGIPESMSATMLLPADFLIVPDGTVVAVNYSTHAAGQWTVEQLLEFATANA